MGDECILYHMYSSVQVMPLYCTSLFMPVLGTLCAVLGDDWSTTATSTLLVGEIFNNVSFLVLGALVINGIFTKCGLEQRFVAFLLKNFKIDGSSFLLVLMLGGMVMCSVLYSGSLVLLAALGPLLEEGLASGAISVSASKRILLGIAFSANAGSVLLPISSPVNLITINLLSEFDHKIDIDKWAGIAVPCAGLAMLASWMFLLLLFPAERAPANAAPTKPLEVKGDFVEMTGERWFFLSVGIGAVLAITIFADKIEPFIGHPACLSLVVVVIAFGSGFMSKQDFKELDWDLLALIGGTNVMALMVRETSLGVRLSTWVVGQDMFMRLPYHGILIILVVTTMTVGTFLSHMITGVLLMPLVIAIGVKLQAGEITAILVAISVPFGMAMAHSSMDNACSQGRSMMLGNPRAVLTGTDFKKAGGATCVSAAFIFLTLGLYIAQLFWGVPPPVVIAGTGTPRELEPKRATQNIPTETSDLRWSDRTADWETFKKRPGKKAFAVGRLEKGMRTRAWAASWNHVDQESANEQAVRDCESVAKECRLIYPPQDNSVAKIRTVQFFSLDDDCVEDDNSTAVDLAERHPSESVLRDYAYLQHFVVQPVHIGRPRSGTRAARSNSLKTDS